ncbi:MAG: Rho termination factor N-terminal domain-containing protein [Filomicrobium sp.]
MAKKPKKNEALRTALTHGRNTGNERLLIQDISSGKILGDVGGTSNQVTLDRSALRKAGSRGARLVHNHPGGGSLSLNDLEKLGRGPADARSVVAISDTGNVYVAKPGKNFRSGHATKQLASKIRERVKADVLADLVVSGKATATPEAAHKIISLTNRELERQGVIQYRELKSRNVESVISERQAPKEFGSTATLRAADRDRRVAEAMKKAKSETGGNLRINREPPKPRTVFEEPPKRGGGEGALRDQTKRGKGQRTGGKGKGPSSLDDVTRQAKEAVARKRGVDKAASADARISGVVKAANPTQPSKRSPTLKQLRAQAKEAGLKGYSKLKKADLVKAIKAPAGGQYITSSEFSERLTKAKKSDVQRAFKDLYNRAPKARETKSELIRKITNLVRSGEDLAGSAASMGSSFHGGKTKTEHAFEIEKAKSAASAERRNILAKVEGKGQSKQSGWSDAARKASAKSRNVAQPGKAKTPKAKGRLRSGNAAIMGLIAAGTGVYALTQGASVAEAAEVTADAGTFGGVSNFKRNRAAGDSKSVATGKAVVQTGADVATGFALSHYREAKGKGISTSSSMIGAAFRGAATLVSAGLGDLVDMGVKAAFPRTAKMPNTRAASRKQKERYARQKMAKRKPAAPAAKRTPAAAEKPDGWVAAHTKRVDGKTVRVDKRRQSNRELRRS